VAGIDLDLEMAMTEQEKENLGEAKASQTWRALRVASKGKLSLFDKFEGNSLERLFQPDTAEFTAEDHAPEGRGADLEELKT
jgi:THO complex subunit 1